MNNLISLSGKASSGKDLVSLIIQLIDAWGDKATVTNIYDSLLHPSSFTKNSKWENKKFAGKLKEIASLLLGVPVERFEDRHFKESKLGKEWAIWEMTSDYEVKYFNTEDELLDYCTANSFPPTDKFNYSYKKIIPTVRQFLQRLGTEALRDGLHTNAWVNATFVNYVPRHKGRKGVPSLNELYSISSCESCKKPFSGYKRARYCQECVDDDTIQFYPHWILSDTRFPNELEAVKKRSGITVKIDSDKRLEVLRIAKAERLAQLDLMKESDDIFYQSSDGNFHLMNNAYQNKFTKLYNKYFNELEDNHLSETAWVNYKFDYIIDNNKDLKHLIKECIKFYKYYNL